MNCVKLLLACTFFFSFTVNAGDNLTSEELVGSYSCTFTQGDYTYDPFRCVIKKDGDKLLLEKLSGSQRIKGGVQITEHGFKFEGIYFCPYGDCTAPANGEFKKISEGKFEGSVYTDDSTPHTLVSLIKKK